MRRIRTLLFVLGYGLGMMTFVGGCSSISPSSPVSTQIPSSGQTASPTVFIDSTRTPEPLPVVPEDSGSLHEFVNNFLDEMPRASMGAYVIPSGTDQAVFADLISLVQSRNLPGSEEIASQNHYQLRYFSDTDNADAKSYLLVEDKPIQKGWGFYAFRDGKSKQIIVEAPHPVSDENTPTVALDIYEALDAQALLIAGAHRDANPNGAADVAHSPTSIFQTVHLALLQGDEQKNDAVVLQIHGYAINKHANYPQVVVGLGLQPNPTDIALAIEIATALKEQGVTAEVCNGTAWLDLCGTKNIQASVMGTGTFIHLEMDPQMREDDSAVITALKRVFPD